MLYFGFLCVKVKKKAVPFQSKTCCGKDALCKLLEGFQQSCGKDIRVGVIGEFRSAHLPFTVKSRDT